MKEYGISELLNKNYEKQTKKGGINSEVTEQRALLATFLDIPIGQAVGITKGWTAKQIFLLREESMRFKANPQALFWKKWKVLRLLYAKETKNREKSKTVL